MKLVNIGCGTVYHAAWINLDSAPCTAEVQRCDVRAGLPFPDACVDAVYHAHVLEHLDAAGAHGFLGECHRVLRPGGILRVVVPDLEGIARAYLRELDSVRMGRDRTLYEWTRLEFTDQAARTRSGGAMAAYLRTLAPAQLAVVRTRAGKEVETVLAPVAAEPRWRRITLGKLWLRVRREIVRGGAMLVGGARMRAAFDEGWFRQSGEVHRVMYDEFSLAALLVGCGFQNPQRCTAFESGIPAFADYRLDVVDGTVRKPDSLYLEVTRA